ncbi:hypothetical protein ABIA00_006122 [Bradyrhizobium ottawaense]
MTRAQIIATTKAGAARAAIQQKDASPRSPKHRARLDELKRNAVRDAKHNEKMFAVA